MFFPPVSDAIVYPLAAEDAPDLWQLVNIVAETLHAPKPTYILVGWSQGISVSTGQVNTVVGKVQGLLLWLPLTELTILSTDNLRAIVAHELAHFRDGDAELTRRFFRLWHSSVMLYTSLLTQQIQRTMEETQFSSIRYILLTPLRLLLKTLLNQFGPAERKQRRAREYIADQASAAVVGKILTAGTLAKYHAYNETTDNVRKAVIYGVTHCKPLERIAAWFQSSATHHTDMIRLQKLERQVIAHPHDTHPTMRERLAALGVELEHIAPETFVIPLGSSAAETLIPKSEQLDKAITAVVNARFQMPFKKASKMFSASFIQS